MESGERPADLTRTSDLTRVLEGLRRELGDDVARLSRLRPVAARREDLDVLLGDLEQQLDRVRRAAVVTLVGATGAGKSTLLNALVGRGIAIEGESRPTTSAPVIYRPRDADVRELIEGLPGLEPAIVDYDPDGGGPWRGQILVDAPDVNSIATEHREVVRALATRSDVLVVVAHRQSISELASVEFVDLFAGRRRMLFLLNRADELTAAARGELLAELSRLATERWNAPEATCLAVSARRAKDDPEDPGWPALCGALSELVEEGRLGRVRRLNALGTAEAIGQVFAEIDGATPEGEGADGPGLGVELEQLERSLRSGLETWRGTLEAELAARLELRESDLRAMLWDEAARRWEGPGGWALRVGGLSAIGFGAGAALARRNPLVAAGAALGGLAADRARESARSRSVRDVAGLLPGASDLESAYRASLGEARLAAARLAAEPGDLAVPDGALLSERAADAVDEGWSRLLERELPAAARAGARPLLRWAVDLPVYALGAWVVYRAAIGFFRSEYVGLDFLVNAALLLLAWLFLGRTLARGLLAGRARSLTGATHVDVTQRLAAVAERSAEPTREVLEPLREALARTRELGRRWRARLLAD